MRKKRLYPCEKSLSGDCEHGGNKNFDYGFMRGCAAYCRHPRQGQFLGDFKECPKSRETPPPEQGKAD